MEVKGIVLRDRTKKSRLLPHDLLLRSRVTASIVRSTISDPKRSLCDCDHVRAFLLYRLYHRPDLRLLMSVRGINSCSEEPSLLGPADDPQRPSYELMSPCGPEQTRRPPLKMSVLQGERTACS